MKKTPGVFTWPRLRAALFALVVFGACSAENPPPGCEPGADSNAIAWVRPDGGAVDPDTGKPLVDPETGQPLGGVGAACDPSHGCAPWLTCRLPAECQPDPAATGAAGVPGSAGGGRGYRCDDEHPCVNGYHCVEIFEIGTCTKDCTTTADCPDGSVCWTDRGPVDGWCVLDTGHIGGGCAYENDCMPGLFCENRASTGYCSKHCDSGVPCPAGMDAVCTKLSGGFGTYCLRRCPQEQEDCLRGTSSDPNCAGYCRDSVVCRKMTQADVFVCWPDF